MLCCEALLAARPQAVQQPKNSGKQLTSTVQPSTAQAAKLIPACIRSQLPGHQILSVRTHPCTKEWPMGGILVGVQLVALPAARRCTLIPHLPSCMWSYCKAAPETRNGVQAQEGLAEHCVGHVPAYVALVPWHPLHTCRLQCSTGMRGAIHGRTSEASTDPAEGFKRAS